MALPFLDPHKASRVDAAKIDCPVLVISGTEDRITPAAVHRNIARKYRPMATYMEFPNHAHWIYGEPGWEEIAGHIDFWLCQNDAVGSED
jgi:pimeloyl-ACP methyl ester carboxylesterase